MKTFGLVSWIVILQWTPGQAQSLYEKPVFDPYEFLDLKANLIQGTDSLFDSFLEKLYQREQNRLERVTVLHIGDSHVQGDFFTGKIRKTLQSVFGNAGRGMIPTYLDDPNYEGPDFSMTAEPRWNVATILGNDSVPVGLCGMVAAVDTPSTVWLYTATPFRKLTLYHGSESSFFDYNLSDPDSNHRDVLCDTMDGGFTKDTYVLSKPTAQLKFRFTGQDSLHPFLLHGINLETQTPGMIWHAIGVRGARYEDYLQSARFFAQISDLAPDLIVVSLGTNEAYDPDFNNPDFKNRVDRLICQIKSRFPHTPVMLTTLPDFLRWRRHETRRSLQAATTIVEMAKLRSLSWWDLYRVMGGLGSMKDWYKAKLGARDRIHFTRRGYELQADLFVEALMEKYRTYVRLRH